MTDLLKVSIASIKQALASIEASIASSPTPSAEEFLRCMPKSAPTLVFANPVSVQSKGGHARAKNLTAKRRSEIASKAAKSRWSK